MKKLLLLFSICSCVIYAKINVDKSSATIQIGSGASFVGQGQINSFKGHLVKDQGATISGGSISFEDGVFEDGGNKVKLTGDLDLTSVVEIVLNGNKSFEGKRGNVLQKVKVQGDNNRLEGVVQLKEDIELTDNTASFTCAVQGRVPCNIIMNGGTIFLDEDLHFVDDMFFTGSAIVILNRRNLHLGSKEMTCAGALYFDNAQDIELHANLHLDESWTFSGESTIEGNGRILYLENNGEIILEQGSSLLLRNITVRGISENNVRGLDSNITLSVQNVNWIQDGNYSFTTGSLHVIEDFIIRGDSIFVYQSAQTSTVFKHAKIIVDRGMTFSFDTVSGSNNLLSFENETSRLELKGATLYVTTTGMKLTKGTLRVKDKSYITSELDGDFHMEEGLIIGDNTSNDDMKVEIASGATLEVTSGAFSYKNTQDSSWSMLNDRSILQINSGAQLKLHQTLDVGTGVTKLESGAVLARASGKKLLGPVYIGGAISYEVCYN